MAKRVGESGRMAGAKRPCASSALDFDNLPYIQSAVERSQIVEYTCLTPLPRVDEAPLEFRIDKTDCYTDLDRTWLFYQAQILNKDGTEVEEEFATYSNNIGYAMFDSVDLFISDQRVTKPESHYPWWTYVYNLLYYSKNAKNHYLETGNGWYPDTPGRFDEVDLTKTFNNLGAKDRYRVFGESKKVWLCIKLMTNTQIKRLVPNQTEIKLRFNRSPTALCMLASQDEEYKIKILDAKLHVNRVKLYDTVGVELEKRLNSTGFFYPGTNPVVRTKTVSQGDQNVDWTPFTGKLPQRLYFFMIRQTAYNGQYNKNPYNFLPFGLNRLQIFNNGRSLPYSQGLTMLPDYSAELKFWMTTLMSINNPETFGIDYYSYQLGNFLVAVDVSSDFSAGCDYNKIDEFGSLRLIVDFSKPLVEGITLFCIGEIQETLKIDGDRNPSFI